MEQKNIGIWIRVSTDMQVKDESPEHHEERARMYAQVKGWNVVTVYRLDALSGKSVMEYSETKRMLKDIQDGTISGIIFSKLARLARNTKELLEISDLFQKNKADLISLAEAIDTSTPAGRLFFTIIAAMAQWEREEISERISASVPIRAKMGKPLGGTAPFGYTWKDKQLCIDEKEATVRKLIYEIFLKTKRIKTTAHELNKLGHRTRNGAKFTGTTVERLLLDPIAKGERIANYSKSTGAGKKWVTKPESEWIKLASPAIISEEIWAECSSILQNRVVTKKAIGPRPIYLFAGFVFCSCGKKMVARNQNPVYKCASCNVKIGTTDLEEIYHEQLKSFLLTNVDVEEYSTRLIHQLEEKQALFNSIESEYLKLSKRLETQWNLRVEGEISKEHFQAFYKPAQEQLQQLSMQMPQLQAEIDFMKIQQLSSDVVIHEANNLFANWLSLPFDEKRSIVEVITQRIEISKDSINIDLSYLPNQTLFNQTSTQGNATISM